MKKPDDQAYPEKGTWFWTPQTYTSIHTHTQAVFVGFSYFCKMLLDFFQPLADLIVQMSPTDTFYSSDHGFSNWWLLPDPGNICLIFMISGNNCAIQLNMKFLSVKNKKVSYPFGPMYTAISNVLHMSVNACFFAQLPSTLSTTWRLERARVKITKTTWHWHITVTSVKSITFQRNAKLRQRLWSFYHSFGFVLRCRVILT